MASKPTDAAARAVDRADVPTDRPRRTLDVRAAGPPKPLSETLETLADLEEEAVLIQRNDRAPQHLYPKLTDRGYEYETIEGDEEVVTAIWRPDA
ncbi:DUF2249 domain-containing protein [Halorussus marinus]|uniref:DUF2249 domain-containing protein n=1 Tax=Halorussus marinus TaxID=2505976 RepID=UPI00106EF644|nr:DUF2249 domain-containing protein [Halorussus marinus]